MSFGLRIIEDVPYQYWGLDLGQRRDYTALALVERSEMFLDEVDPVTYERKMLRRFRVRYLRRVPLGTAYPDVVTRVREVLREKAIAGRSTLVVDGTGVGAPVLDMLRRAGLGCRIEAVILTGGERETHTGGTWHVPKRDVLTGLKVMLENDELEMSMKVTAAGELLQEMGNIQIKRGKDGKETYGAWRAGEHDDLTMAMALAAWRAKYRAGGLVGTGRIV